MKFARQKFDLANNIAGVQTTVQHSGTIGSSPLTSIQEAKSPNPETRQLAESGQSDTTNSPPQIMNHGPRAHAKIRKRKKKHNVRNKKRSQKDKPVKTTLDIIAQTPQYRVCTFTHDCSHIHDHFHISFYEGMRSYHSCNGKLCTKTHYHEYSDDEFAAFYDDAALADVAPSYSPASTIETLATSSEGSRDSDYEIPDGRLEEKYPDNATTEEEDTKLPSLLSRVEAKLTLLGRDAQEKLKTAQEELTEWGEEQIREKSKWQLLATGIATTCIVASAVAAGPLLGAAVLVKACATTGSVALLGYGADKVKDQCNRNDESVPYTPPPIPTYHKTITEKHELLDNDGEPEMKNGKPIIVVRERKEPFVTEERIIFTNVGRYEHRPVERLMKWLAPSWTQQTTYLANKQNGMCLSEMVQCAPSEEWHFDPWKFLERDTGDRVLYDTQEVQYRHCLKKRYKFCYQASIFREMFDGLMADKKLTTLAVLDRNKKVKFGLYEAVKRVGITLYPDESATNAELFNDTLMHVTNQLVTAALRAGQDSAAPLD